MTEFNSASPISRSLETTTLYRPVCGLEHHLIRQSDNKSFPVKFHRSGFYPVRTEEYASMVAANYYAKTADYGNIGFVVKFNVRTAFISCYAAFKIADDKEYRI